MGASDNFPAGSKISASEIASARKHLFLCLGPDCCDTNASTPLWDLLKAETRRLSVPALRTKAACLRVCKDGPWLLVYPDGIWYGQMTAERLLRILREHVEGGRPVREWIAATGAGCGPVRCADRA